MSRAIYLTTDQIEKDFESHLETKTEFITWWFKNGVSKKIISELSMKRMIFSNILPRLCDSVKFWESIY